MLLFHFAHIFFNYHNNLGQQSTRFINFEDSYWHADCFICVDCRTRLEGRGFIRDGPDIICGECAKIKLQAEIEATI